MLDPDISAADARALLTVRDDDPKGINRRRFLQLLGWGVGGTAVLNGLGVGVLPNLIPGQLREAWAGGPLGANEGVLILVCLDGGNDGLNMVVPYTKPQYYSYRANIAIPQSSLLLLNGELGLHPNLVFLKSLWDRQEVAVVQGVGYPDPNLSHFDSMATWMYGRAGGGLPSTGWIGRWLDGLGGDVDAFKAASIGTGLPLHLLGANRRGLAIPPGGFDFGGKTDAPNKRMYTAVKQFAASDAGRGQWHSAVALAEKGQIETAQTVTPMFTPAIADTQLARQLVVAARLINADIGLRVLDTSLGGFDNHSDEPTEHGNRMAQLDAGLKAFYTALNPAFRSRVTIMTFSEFGRTPWSNDSLGTDHGTSTPHFVIGGNVKGGVYGVHPSLTKSNGKNLAQWERLGFSVDFRSLYATMLDGVLGGGASTVLNGNFEKLDLFRPPPPPNTGGSGGSAGSDFVGIVPVRLLDTREGPGVPLGPVSSISLPVAGQQGIPLGAVAAVLNVTAVDATATSFLTVWPTGFDRPSTSSLNVAGRDIVPNLVISKLGSGGQVDIYNNAGSVHCVVDVVGYFQTTAAGRFTPLTPDRLLDTRAGIGAPAGAVGQDQSIDVQVSGVRNVGADADSVVMNVTVTEPNSPGFITVWPTGTDKPTASNLNFVPGQTVPNLVVAKLGAGGKVSLYNSAGSTHLIADVLGYFSAGGGTRLTALTPDRLLDTRTDGGVSQPVGQTPLALPVLNRNGVPASGVAAVVLNVTATEGTSAGYVTVYPSGEGQPTASNLNIAAGQTRANLVIAKVGADGCVALFNSSGTVHLLADVVGYFSA